MTEEEYQQRIIDTALLRGWRVAHFRPAKTSRGWRTPMQGHTGFPDLVLARQGYVIVPEVKTDTGRLRPGQREWIDALGAHARLWRPRDWHDVEAELQRPEET